MTWISSFEENTGKLLRPTAVTMCCIAFWMHARFVESVSRGLDTGFSKWSRALYIGSKTLLKVMNIMSLWCFLLLVSNRISSCYLNRRSESEVQSFRIFYVYDESEGFLTYTENDCHIVGQTGAILFT